MEKELYYYFDQLSDKDKEEIIKSNKTNVISLKLQNDKYRELIKKYEEKLD